MSSAVDSIWQTIVAGGSTDSIGGWCCHAAQAFAFAARLNVTMIGNQEAM